MAQSRWHRGKRATLSLAPLGAPACPTGLVGDRCVLHQGAVLLPSLTLHPSEQHCPTLHVTWCHLPPLPHHTLPIPRPVDSSSQTCVLPSLSVPPPVTLSSSLNSCGDVLLLCVFWSWRHLTLFTQSLSSYTEAALSRWGDRPVPAEPGRTPLRGHPRPWPVSRQKSPLGIGCKPRVEFQIHIKK